MRSGPFALAAALAGALTGCLGGQTGEITELTACHLPVGAAAIGDASEAGPAAAEQLAALVARTEGALTWAEGVPTTVVVEVTLTGEPATLLGGPECERPWLEAPATLSVRTADGALDETLPGAVLFAGGVATASAEVAADALRGSLETEGALRLRLVLQRDALQGELALRDGETDRLLAWF